MSKTDIEIENMRTIILLLSQFLLIPVWASSVVIQSGSSDAQECAAAAHVAAQTSSSSEADINLCSKALEDKNLLRRDEAATLVNRAVIYMQQSNYRAAHTDLIEAKNLHSGLGAIYINLGNIYFLGAAPEKAIEFYTTALAKGTSSTHVAYMNRGLAKKELGLLQSALKDIRQAVQLQPEWHLAKEKLEQLEAELESKNN
ncbi:MAG: hypothetical protein HKO58_02320 [Gammaproteobacteria bacterium]|nr:hypothetical protein [Gammaproteobacteria bacterium]